ncbi:MAG TPA: amidase family protein [Polyangiaceae bacterium]|nr:amidase family protein [Polyangiaceae bacterium]
MSDKDLNFLARLDGVAQAELVARGELSSAELLDACETRFGRCEPLIHSTVTLDWQRARAGKPAEGPFKGVPTLLKDVFPYPGLRWGVGSRLFAQNRQAPATPYGEHIDRSGLVVVGKSASSEFGMLGSTETLQEGVTHNPWDLSRSAAGSSGGAAAAVAAGIVPLAHANDAGGSIRVPASVCGVFGFKPSRGRCVPANPGGSDFMALVSDHCITRSVRDSALFLSVTEAHGGPLPAIGYVREASSKRLRIATFTRTPQGGEPEPAVRRAFDEAVALCTRLGHEVRAIAAPALNANTLGDAFFLSAGAAMAGMIEMIAGMRGTAVRPDELEPFTWSLIRSFQARGAGALEVARATFSRAANEYLDAFTECDVLLTPTLSELPWRLGHLSPLVEYDELLARTARAVGYTPIHNIAGCPGMSVPLHWSPENLPIGVHFAANVGHDQTLLRLAYELEAAQPWHERWAPYSFPRIIQR